MSDPELVSYKKQMISELTSIFNTNVSNLQKQYQRIFKYIYSFRIPYYIKRYYVQYYTNKYNQAFKSIQNKLTAEIATINLLTNIPGRIVVQPTIRSPDKFALIVGINYLNTVNELTGCINDSNNMNQFFNGYAYNKENVVMLTDETSLKPTKINIINEFTNLLQKSINGDSLVFYYSGHGTNTYDLNGDEIDGLDEVIVPIDATSSIKSCILDDELKTIIDNNLKPGVKLFILMDCCFSGTICDLKCNYIDKDNFDNTTINTNSYETVAQVICISGCSDKQISLEATVTDGVTQSTVGAMSFAFINTISENGDKISMKDLLEGMRTLLSDNMFTQTVQMSSGRQMDISNTLLTDIF